jgi:uncharacterized protein (UPF0264 family)
VSVRKATEAMAALAGGAAIIDVKEPAAGQMGKANDDVIRAIAVIVSPKPLSAAMGEVIAGNLPPPKARLRFAKWGLAGCAHLADWPEHLSALADKLRRQCPRCCPVPVAYADTDRAKSPALRDVIDSCRKHGWSTLLIDTYAKNSGSLLNVIPARALAAVCHECRSAGITVALAGSLDEVAIRQLRNLPVRWFGVRGAACRSGDRFGSIDSERVARLARAAQPLPSANAVG